jgi:uncharacterized membrane protein YjfL (UPF0719 family)
MLTDIHSFNHSIIHSIIGSIIGSIVPLKLAFVKKMQLTFFEIQWWTLDKKVFYFSIKKLIIKVLDEQIKHIDFHIRLFRIKKMQTQSYLFYK